MALKTGAARHTAQMRPFVPAPNVLEGQAASVLLFRSERMELESRSERRWTTDDSSLNESCRSPTPFEPLK